MLKARMLVVVLVSLCLVCFSVSAFSAEENVTMLKMAESVAKVANIQITDEMKKLSGADYYNALADLLAKNNISDFVGKNPSDPVEMSQLIVILSKLACGEGAVDENAKIQCLLDNGILPEDFKVVLAVRGGIKKFYETNNNKWPSALDVAKMGNAAKENPLFANVITPAVEDKWIKSGDFFYTAPFQSIYTYDPNSGRFDSTNPVTLSFVLLVFSNPQAYTEMGPGNPDKPGDNPPEPNYP